MWTMQVGDAGRPDAVRCTVRRESNPATYLEIVEAWRCDADFRSWFNAQLASASFAAFRWETPPVVTATAGQPFEFVLLGDPNLAREPEPSAFEEHFRGRFPAEAVSFPNLGGDAIMVVPRPIAPPSAYGHLAAFVRDAPDRQRHALWQAVGEAMSRRLGTKPVWLSTAGAGVSWLHVRLDDRPKYYAFTPYKTVS